jgi:hypothetical protein
MKVTNSSCVDMSKKEKKKKRLVGITLNSMSPLG